MAGVEPIPSGVDEILQVDGRDPAPAYVQLERRVRMAVADGNLQPGDRLPSVRSCAARLGVSSNTVGRAYADLAREGVIVARAGGGSEVARPEQLNRPALLQSRRERLQTLARQVVVRGLALGLEPTEIADAVAAELASRGRPIPANHVFQPLGSEEVAVLSTRNRLRGNVTAIRVGDVVAEVTLSLANGNQVVAAITRTSLERLALQVGSSVSTYVKATELVLGR